MAILIAKQPPKNNLEEFDLSALLTPIAHESSLAAASSKPLPMSFPEVYACVREGDVEGLVQHLHNDNFVEYHRPSVNRMHFSSIVSVFCGVLLMCSRLGGLPIERGLTITSKYIKKTFESAQSEDMIEFIIRLHVEFTEEVYHHRIKDADHTLATCRAYLYSNIQEKIDLADLATSCGYTLSGLQHYFRRKTGMTLTCYIRQEKIRKAQFLLLNTNDSCAHIGQRLAFCSQSYFISQFKRETGLTPQDFRRHSTR